MESAGNYCPECGQEIEIKRLDVKSIFKDGTHRFLHWENPSLNTFKKMFTNPGQAAKDYIAGLRKSVIKPYKYFLTIQTLHVLFFHSLSKNYFEYQNYTNSGTATTEKDVMQMQQLISSNIKYFDYFIPLFFALYAYLFFKKKTGINYAESLALSFYWVGTSLLISVLFMLLSLIDIRMWNGAILINIVYLIIAGMQFTKMRKMKGILTSAAVVVLSYLTYLAFATSIILIYLSLFSK